MDELNIVAQMKAYTDRHKLTQSDFSRQMKVCPSAVSHWFAGTREPNTKNYITFQTLLKEEENGSI